MNPVPHVGRATGLRAAVYVVQAVPVHHYPLAGSGFVGESSMNLRHLVVVLPGIGGAGTAESALRLLRAGYQVTPFQGRDELTVLSGLCEDVLGGTRTGLVVITGRGGAAAARGRSSSVGSASVSSVVSGRGAGTPGPSRSGGARR